MIVALFNGKLARALPGSRGACPECRNAVYARIPEGAIRHWAHMPLSEGETRDCSNDAGEMTEWHQEWQDLRIDTDSIEVYHDGFRADAINQAGVVIEFQHSPISPVEIARREAHWGRGVWVLDGTGAEDGKPRVTVMRKPEQPAEDTWCRYKWPRSPGLLFRAKWPCWIDLGTRGLIQVYSAEASGGNGWQVARDWFIAEVLNGRRAVLRRHDPKRTEERIKAPRRRSVATAELDEDLSSLVMPCDRPPIERPACSLCEQSLLAPQSLRRGYCERCRIDKGLPVEVCDTTKATRHGEEAAA